MCGIAGVVRHGRRDRARTRRRRSAPRSRIAARTAHGVWRSPAATSLLVHRRLAIIDPGPSGAQPMAHAGRPPSHRVQRRDLQLPRAAARRSKRAASSSRPAATPKCCCGCWRATVRARSARVRGMFALAWWDAADALAASSRAIGSASSRCMSPRRPARSRSRRRSARSWRPASSSAPSIRPACSAYLSWGTRAAAAHLDRRRREPAAGHMAALDADGRARQRPVRGRRRGVTRGPLSGCDRTGDLQARVRRRGAGQRRRASGRRRAGRRLPLGRHRFVGDSVGGRQRRRAGLNTYTVRFDDSFVGARVRAAGRVDASARRITSSCSTRRASSRDLPRILRHLDQPTLDAVNSFYVSRGGRGDRHQGGAVGHRRRRAVRRLSVVPPPAGRGPLEAAAAADGSGGRRRRCPLCCPSG